MRQRRAILLTLLAATSLSAPPAAAQETPRHPWLPSLLGAQLTVFGQHLAPFHALYDGPNSLTHLGDTEATDTYGAYLGWRFTGWLQAYLDIELALGNGVGHAVGLAGVSNGDILRSGSVDLGHKPYAARAFLRVLVPLSAERDTATRAIDQLPGTEPSSRLEIKLGKLAASDDIDVNRYANTTRSQFANWGLINNGAWDYAADTRGYTWGLMTAWVHPVWTLRLGEYMMPTFANGNVFDTDVGRARGDNLELTLHPGRSGAALRFLAYQNHGRMGNYAEAVAFAESTLATRPNIVADDRPGRAKRGLAVNAEQPLADSGETGLFLRAGWNDGHTESFVFTEVDREVSAGLQLDGTHWHRRADRIALALAVHGISSDHQAYLAAGGNGFLLGDGRLRYGPEEIVEAYYRFQVVSFLQLSADAQYVANPGYNRDRGPATIVGLRLNARY